MTTAKVLIVDDETIMRESLAGWLERDGHAVQTARSGEEALRKCKENRFDILLLDIKMEGMSGLEVLRRVKESDADVAVVMITAYGSIATAIEAMKNGAFDYMLKPFDPNELDPQVMLFDEPYTGLDQDASSMLDEVLRRVAIAGRTVLMTSHDLPRAADLATRIDVLSRGVIAARVPQSENTPAGLIDLYRHVTRD